MATLEPGQSFGRFSIINFVRADSLGTVYKAYDPNTARDVQLTVIASSLAAQSGFADRFAATTKPLLNLVHPNLLGLLDAGAIDGSFYLVSPAVDAQTLAERQGGGSMAPADVQRLFAQVGAALDFLHGKGITHGALAPDKILVDSSGNALLGGFGLSGLTASPAAPAPDNSADMFGLAAVLAGLLTGSAVLAANAVAPEMFQPLVASLPTDKAAAAASAYAGVLQKALSLDPSARYASVADLLAAWKQVGATAGAAPTPTISKPTQTPARPPTPPAPRTSTPMAVPPIVPPVIFPPASIIKPPTTPVAQPPAATTPPPIAKPDAAQVSARQALVDHSMQMLQQIAEERAGSKLTPEQQQELSRLMHVVRDIADKRARGQLNSNEQRAALTDLARQLKTIRPQEIAAGPSATALARARSDAVQEINTARQAAAGTARREVKQVSKTTSRFVAIGFLVLFFVCVVCPVISFIGSFFASDETPTPRPRQVETIVLPPTRSATSTATRVVQATPVATIRGSTPAASVPTIAAPLITRPIFTDTFQTGKCALPEGDNSSRTASCTNNEYVILNKNTNGRWFYYDDPAYTDLALEADVRMESGPSSTEYGLIWHVSSDGNTFYGMTLRSNGTMSIFTYANSEYDYFTRGFTVQGFNRGQNVKNHIKIYMQGGEMSFEVNGQSQVLTLGDSKLDKGTVGFLITGSPQNSKIAFSNLVVSEFAPAPPVVPGPIASPTR